MNDFSLMFQAGIFLIGFLSFVFGFFYFMLKGLRSELKADISRLEKGQSKLSADMAEIKKLLSAKS